MEVRVLVVERSPFLRLVLREVLTRANHQTVGECEELDEAAKMAGALGPDVVLLDLDDSQEESLAKLNALRRRAPAARLIALGSYDKCPAEAMNHGVEVYLNKPCTPEAVLTAIRRHQVSNGVLLA